MRFPSFEQLAEVIRDSAQLRRDKRIDPDTQVFRDLDRLERMVLLELHKLRDIQEQTGRAS